MSDMTYGGGAGCAMRTAADAGDRSARPTVRSRLAV